MSKKVTRSDSGEIQTERVKKIRSIISAWGARNYRDFPWRNSDIPWHGLVAEILLQRTRAENVVPVYRKFIERFPEPEDLARASIGKIEKIIDSLGLRWRALQLKKLGIYLFEHGGKLPHEYDGMIQLPGVGDYVAAAWLSFHGNRRGVIVDSNIVRFLCRLVGEGMNGETRRKKWLIQIAERMTPKTNSKKFNYAMLDFTMSICGKKPRCAACPIGECFCIYGQTNNK